MCATASVIATATEIAITPITTVLVIYVFYFKQ